ncbi:MAG TPA: polysaccharide biosynthesis/export family protein [Candidatus Binatia bacterium]|nr:polysaccharide biosynthesis/export family protein [Candidatus Binatia bacterium]
MRTVLAFVLAAVAAGCAGSRGPTPREDLRVPAADRGPSAREQARIQELFVARTRTASDYCLGPGDVLTISVFGWEAMRDQQVRVSPTGTIDLPLVGSIPVAGRTEGQAREAIEQRLRKDLMRDPHVSLFVQRFQSQQVSVTGAVARPGLYSLTRDNRTIYDVIAQAGGLTDQAGGRILFSPATTGHCGAPSAPRTSVQTASLRTASVPTNAADALAPIEIEVDAPLAAGQPNPLAIPVVGGDSIVVTHGRFMVDGWVQRPGLYSFTPGVTAFGAMTVAGGALFPADLRHAEIIRAKRDGGKEVLHIDLESVGTGQEQDVSLREGDVVRLNASPLKMIPYSVYWTFNNLFRVGAGVSVAGA